MPRMTKKRYAIAAGIGAVALTAGAAFAYWTSTGTGSSTATTGTSTAFTVSVTNTSPDSDSGTAGVQPAALTPGGPNNTYSYTVTNPSTGHQNLSNVAVVLSVDSAHATLCDASTNYAVTGLTSSPGDLAPGGTSSGVFTVSMNNLPSPQDDCQGATVTATVNAS